MSKLWEFEDFLQREGVFVNGLNGRRSHMDSYMTCLDFPAFDKAWIKAHTLFTEDELMEVAGQMNYHSYLSPMAGLTSMVMQNNLCPAFRPIVGLAREREEQNELETEPSHSV